MAKLIIPLIDKSTVQHICDITTQVCGLPDDCLTLKTRQQTVSIPRMVASNIARVEKGIHYCCIADVLQKDRSSIYHYEKQHKVLFSTWKPYRDMFKKVLTTFESNKEDKIKTILATIHTDSSNIKEIEQEIILTLKKYKHSLTLELL